MATNPEPGIERAHPGGVFELSTEPVSGYRWKMQKLLGFEKKLIGTIERFTLVELDAAVLGCAGEPFPTLLSTLGQHPSRKRDPGT